MELRNGGDEYTLELPKLFLELLDPLELRVCLKEFVGRVSHSFNMLETNLPVAVIVDPRKNYHWEA